MNIFNGFIKAVKTWLILDEKLKVIEHRLDRLESRIDEIYQLIIELLRK